MANQDYIAIYPTSPCQKIGDEKINMFENLKNFRDELVQSLKRVLDEERQAVLIRIAHVGLTKKDIEKVRLENRECKAIFYCENVYQYNQRCYFVPTIGDASGIEEFKKVEFWVDSKQGVQCRELTFSYGFHADPLTFAQTPKGVLVKSITYGENDVETSLAWLNLPSEEFGEVTPGKSVDAYVLFNSTFNMRNYGVFQVIHGGFKAKDWNDISYFKENIEPNENDGPISVNPHWIRGDDKGVLMIVGDEKTWFFSMPIAPPPFYFYAQRYRKVKQSTKMINKLLEGDITEQLKKLTNKLGIKDDEVVKEVLAFVKMYRQGNGEDSNSMIAQSLNTQRVVAAAKILEEYGFTPQVKFNHSYLDLYLTKPKDEQLKPSWYIAILLLLLIDTYLVTVKKRFDQKCGQM